MKRNDLRNYDLLVLGAVVQAASMDLFFIPGQIAPGRVSELAQLNPFDLVVLLALSKYHLNNSQY